jgi:hypothetical protein
LGPGLPTAFFAVFFVAVPAVFLAAFFAVFLAVFAIAVLFAVNGKIACRVGMEILV